MSRFSNAPRSKNSRQETHPDIILSLKIYILIFYHSFNIIFTDAHERMIFRRCIGVCRCSKNVSELWPRPRISCLLIIVPNLIWNKHIYFQAELAAGQGENVLQDMFVHTPRIISRIEQMGNATISSLNVSTAPDVSRSLQTINQSIITMQKEILSLKSSQTIPGIRRIKRSREVIDTPLSGHDLNNESDQEDAIDTF